MQTSQQSIPDKRIEQHPCYSKDAHHHYARIHLPVAPACNIQCNYCNRKYDCSNESRPGVVSRLLTVEQAVSRVTTVRMRIPETSVVGIAGPGDALANASATLETFDRLKQLYPDLHLCVSTNGLMLPDYVDALQRVGVQHLTVTLNGLDASRLQYLYAWIYFNNRRYRGIKAARLLLQRQLEGVQQAVAAGMLVKVNSVLVPGINEGLLPDLSEWLKQAGVFVHNVMPLISDASHGTLFGLRGVAGPSESLLQRVREVCGRSLPVMQHCQQCRADAVGKLTDKNCCSDNKPISNTQQRWRVAVASQHEGLIDAHFGHVTAFQIYDVTASDMVLVEQRAVQQYCQGESDCDAQGADRLQQALAALHDCQAVFCARIGMGPWQQLEQRGVLPIVDYAYLSIQDSVRQAFAQHQATQELNYGT